jgi:hypothetical protein
LAGTQVAAGGPGSHCRCYFAFFGGGDLRIGSLAAATAAARRFGGVSAIRVRCTSGGLDLATGGRRGRVTQHILLGRDMYVQTDWGHADTVHLAIPFCWDRFGDQILIGLRQPNVGDDEVVERADAQRRSCRYHLSRPTS